MPTKTASPKVTITEKVRTIAAEIKSNAVEREIETDLILRAVIGQANGLLIGPPGAAKSFIIDTLLTHIEDDVKIFKLLFAKDTTSDQALGPVSMQGLKNDEYRRHTDGKLPDAHLSFADEIFKANSTVLNALLKIINEGVFDNNGHTAQVPLWSMIGASNELPGPDRDDLTAFRDRFAFTRMVDHVRTSDGVQEVLRGQVNRRQGSQIAATHTMLTIKEIEELQAKAVAVDVPESVVKALSDLYAKSNAEEMQVSLRRMGEGVKLMQASAAMNDRTEVSTDDLRVFEHVLWTDPDDRKTAYELTLEYAGQVTKQAAKVRGSFEEQKKALNDLQSEMPPPGEMPDSDLMGKIGKVSNMLRSIRDDTQAKIERAEEESHDATELKELDAEMEQATKTVAKMLGIGD